MINELEQLGVATNDAKVYEALVRLGPTGGGEISRQTGFHRNIVYESLDRLLSRRLITKIYRNKITLFQISDPKKLLFETKQKVEIAEELAADIEKQSNVINDITVYDGEEGFRTFWKSHIARMKAGDEYYVLGSLGDLWSNLMEPILPWLIKQIKRKKVSIRCIAYAVNSKDNTLLKAGINYKTRYIPKGYQVPANVNIWGDYIFLQTGVPPYSVIDIYNPVLAKAYKSSFDELWDIAEEYLAK